MRFNRTLAAALCCLALTAAACGDGGAEGEAPDDAEIPTATLPAELPPATVVGGGGVVQPGGGTTYSIKAGDTLAGVAERFGVSLEDLLAANPGIDPSSLHSGDNVRLPEGTEPVTPQPAPTAEAEPPAPFPTAIVVTETPAEPPTPEPPAGGTVYVVKSGDIPLTIAEAHGITVEELLAANPGLDPRSLQVGDEVIIPPPPPESG